MGQSRRSLTIADGYLLGIAIDASGDLFICDIGNGCVQRVRPADW